MLCRLIKAKNTDLKANLHTDLRSGYTTGTCCAAVAKAATWMLFNGDMLHHIQVGMPDGDTAMLEIADIQLSAHSATCTTIKDAGDDPDITNGIKVHATATIIDSPQVQLIAGKGIGTVTKPGMAVAVGQAAINPVPLAMIRQAISDVLPEGKGVAVELAIPEGVAVAKRTFNPRLGIVGGISVLGTTGIVKPMSEEALKNSLELELKMLAHQQTDYVILVPGNYAISFLQQHCKVDTESVVQTSNFIGFMLEKAVKYGFKKVLLVGHIGKLIKLAAGIFHTHSRIADARNETMAAHYLAFCSDAITAKQLMAVNTTEEAVELIQQPEFWPHMANVIRKRAQNYVYGELDIEVVLFSQQKHFLGASDAIDSFNLSLQSTPNVVDETRGAHISICGIGPGHAAYILPQVYRKVAVAEVLIGGKRHLELFRHPRKVLFNGRLADLNKTLVECTGKRVTVVVSGDTGFYSLRNYITNTFPQASIDLVPGISSFQYLYAKLNMGYEKGKLLSLHGRTSDFITELKANENVFMLTDRVNTFQHVALTLIKNGLGNTHMVVGNNLSYPNEEIITGKASELAQRTDQFELCAIILKHEINTDLNQ